jgi:plasmid stabilization system protein ParE
MQEHEVETYRVVISKLASQQLVRLAAFTAKLEERLAYQLAADFRTAADSLQHFPYRNPVLRDDVYPMEKYRKMVFDKWYLLIYQIKGDTVYVEYVIDGRQDYSWLLTK